ncbi:MAG: hypothetical protein ACKN9D_13510 [Actinomycetales bacterium]
MGKQDKMKSASVTPLGGPMTMVSGGYGPAVSEVPPTVGTGWAEALPAPSPPAPQDPTQQRLVDLSIERETMAVRLEEVQRQRADLEARMTEVATTRAEMERQLAELQADRERLAKQNKELEDQVLRLPDELAAVTNSRAFKILKAGPFMAMRQPLSTLLIIAGMGELTNLWSFSGLGSSVYIGVAAVVLVVTAVQFWASHD